jgi:hypothetical protein
MAEDRQRCKECHRLLPKPKEPVFSPICKLCKQPLIKTGHWWVCSNKDMSHRGLIHRSTVAKAGWDKKPHETFEV